MLTRHHKSVSVVRFEKMQTRPDYREIFRLMSSTEKQIILSRMKKYISGGDSKIRSLMLEIRAELLSS